MAIAPAAADERREVRLALVMNGGVSLAIWIGGVVAEIDRARRAGLPRTVESDDPVLRAYAELLDVLGSVVRTDVIAGASAGGLNGCLLAAAIANGGAVDDLRDTWIELASFRDMLRSGLAASPPSVLKGDEYFLPELEREFKRRCRAQLDPTAGAPRDEDRVELFVTGTDLIGEPVGHLDDFGGTLHDREHRGLFHFRHDPSSGESSFTEPGVDRRLARVARSTASFPGAFEASFCRVGEVPPAENGVAPAAGDVDLAEIATFSSSRWVVDGGVLDNAPFRPALGAIARAPSRGAVRRVLVYVTPYGAPADVPGAVRARDPAFRAVVGAAFSLPREVTLTETLVDLEQHRRRVSRIEESRRAILAGIDDLAAHAAGLLGHYRRQRTRGSVEWVLDRLLTTRGARTSREAARSTSRPRTFVSDIVAAGLELPWVPASTTPVELPAEDAPWPWGTAPVGRAARLTLSLLSSVLAVTPATEATALDRQHVFDARELLSDVISTLARREEDMFAAAETIRDAGRPDPALDEHMAGAEAAVLGPEAREQLVLVWCAARAYETMELDARAELLQVASALGEGGGAALRLLEASATMGLAPRRRADLEEELRRLLQAQTNEELARRLLELEVVQQAVTPDEGDPEQPLSWLRLNAEARCALDPRDRPDEKLTGLGLAHFAAFYKRSWRANDWMWGRLDGAARLMDVLVDPVHLRLALGASTTPDELAARLARIALGDTEDDARFLRERAGRLYKSRTPEEVIKHELVGLSYWDLEGEPTSRLEATRDLLTARLQLHVLRDELPVVRRAALDDAGDEGASPEAAGAAWARRQDSLRDESPPPRVLVGALNALRLAESESIPDEAGASLLTRNVSTVAVVAASALAAPRGGLPAVVRLVPRALRGLLLPLYGLTWSLTSRRPAVRAVGLLVLVAALAILAWSLLGDVDARENDVPAKGPPGWASALAKGVVGAALLLGVLRARLIGLAVVAGFAALYAALLLTPWPQGLLGHADRAWKTNSTLAIVAALVAVGLLAGLVGGSGPVESVWLRLGEPSRAAVRRATRIVLAVAALALALAGLVIGVPWLQERLEDLWGWPFWALLIALALVAALCLVAFASRRRAARFARLALGGAALLLATVALLGAVTPLVDALDGPADRIWEVLGFWWLAIVAGITVVAALLGAIAALLRARRTRAALEAAKVGRVLAVGGNRRLASALRVLAGDEIVVRRRVGEGFGVADVRRELEWLRRDGSAWRTALVRPTAELRELFGDEAREHERGYVVELRRRRLRDLVMGTAGDAFRVTRLLRRPPAA